MPFFQYESMLIFIKYVIYKSVLHILIQLIKPFYLGGYYYYNNFYK